MLCQFAPGTAGVRELLEIFSFGLGGSRFHRSWDRRSCLSGPQDSGSKWLGGICDRGNVVTEAVRRPKDRRGKQNRRATADVSLEARDVVGTARLDVMGIVDVDLFKDAN